MIVVTVLVGLGVGYLLRTLTQSDRNASPQPTPVPTASTASASPASPSATCDPGAEQPLRQDLVFPAQDGKGTPVNFSISLPEDYFADCRTYPVVYALHGKEQDNAGFMEDALSLREPMAAGVLDEAIIVTPDSYSTGRWENRDTGPAEDNFIKYLIPHIEENYRVTEGPAHRLLVGFSMGGHGAMRFGLKYPDMFAAVWSVDGAMAHDSADYLQFVEGRSDADFHIIAVGGQLNGSRVQTVVDALAAEGIDIQYAYQDREHEFTAFVDEDENAGWFAMKYLQENLGRPM